MEFLSEQKIAIGFALDLLLGDPHWFYHPIRLVGKLISGLEKFLYKLTNKILGGMILLVLVTGIVYSSGYFLCRYVPLMEIILIYFVLATRSLGSEAFKIYRALNKNDLKAARQQISLLVSRDTGKMSKEDIARAAIETAAENIVDAIIAPLFYLFIGGAPLALAYKAVNTLDSMVGYKNKRYQKFGWASARLDDLLNFIPARITGFVLIPLAMFLYRKKFLNTLRIVWRDRLKHPSPNSAHSEAAVAGGLGIRLGGPAVYFGKRKKRLFIGDESRKIEIADIKRTIWIMYITAGLGLGLGVLVCWLFA